MKRPATPPDPTTLRHDAAASGRLSAILDAVREIAPNGKYHHWDTLRNYPPPSGLSHREWWLGVKLRRQGLARTLPLSDPSGKAFHYLLPDPIPERLHEFDFQAGGALQMPTTIANPATKEQYYVNSLIEEAVTSSQLEGASTTRRVAADMLRSRRHPRDRSEQMIHNNYHAMLHIGEMGPEALTPNAILNLHRIVTTNTLDDASAAGRLRSPSEQVTVVDPYGEILHEPPPAEQLPRRMAELCDFANGNSPPEFVHPLVRSILLHFWLAYDHPFVDGNGRTARALFYWSARRHGYWLVEYLSISSILRKAPVQYGKAFLDSETDENDLTYFLLHHIRVLDQALDALQQYLRRKAAQIQEAEAQLRGVATLNHRQRALISHALRHPHQIYTIEGHRNSHQVSYQTARTDLLDLADRSLLQRRLVGKHLEFVRVADLERRLQT